MAESMDKPKRTDQEKRKNAARRPLLVILVVIIVLGLIPLYSDYRNSLNQPLSPQEEMTALANMNDEERARYYETQRAKTAAYETAFALTPATATATDNVIREDFSSPFAPLRTQDAQTQVAASQTNAAQLIVTCAMAIYRVDHPDTVTWLEDALIQASIAFESVSVQSDSEAYTCGSATPAPGQLNVRRHYALLRLAADEWANQSETQRGDAIMGIIAPLDSAPLSESTLLRIESGTLKWELNLAQAQTKIKAGTRGAALWEMGVVP